MAKSQLILALITLFHLLAAAQNNSGGGVKAVVPVGVILDLGTLVGRTGKTSIDMAVEDFYAAHQSYGTRVALHFRDGKSDVLEAASGAFDLLGNVQVQAIIGPQKSQQASFAINLGNRTHVPIVAFSATSPFLSSIHSPYFIRTTPDDSAQVKAVSSIIKSFRWREVVLVYEDTDYGRGVIPYFVDALQEVDAKISYRSAISPAATSDQIIEELYKMMTMETRIYMVHMLPPMGRKLLSRAKEAGMMNEGYAWIMTDGLSSVVDSFDHSIIDNMQGVLGVRLHIPRSTELKKFNVRWKKRFQEDHPSAPPAELSKYGLLAYDTTVTIAMAVEKVGPSSFQTQKNVNDTAGLDSLPISSTGPKLFEAISKNNFTGLSGKFHLIDGQLQYSTFQIINVIGKGARGIGYWTPTLGLSKNLNPNHTNVNSTSMHDLNPIIWPGETLAVPRGWTIPTSGRKLRIGVPIKHGYREFVDVKKDPFTNATIVQGFNIDVFETVIQNLPYDLPYEYFPFENVDGEMAGTYNDLVYEVYLQKYDAVVGDISIRANRSRFVDFTLPYSESGVYMVVRVEESTRRDAWIFLKPWTLDLWLGSLAFFFLTGLVVWIMEHRINSEFRGPISQQLGVVFYFSFSTLVFAHREKLESTLSRIVVIIWVFVILILTSSFTASLSAILTVEQLQPTVTTIHELLKNGDYVGVFNGSFIEDLLLELHFDRSKLRSYNSPDELAEALLKGSKNGGISAFFHETPYIRAFLAHHCKGFTMIGPIYKAEGFGFAFPQGSPLVADVSRALLKVLEGDTMINIEKKWLGDQNACLNQGSIITSSSLSFRSFSGLFAMTGATTACALLAFLINFFYNNWDDLKKIDPDEPIYRRVVAWLKYYDKIDVNSHNFKTNRPTDYSNETPVIVDEMGHRTSISSISDLNSDFPEGSLHSSP